MAEREKQRAMVLFEDGMATPTLAPRSTTTPPSIQAVLKQLQPDDSGADNSSPIAISESNKMGKSSPLLADIKLEHFPADVRCKGVTVTLDNNNMWNEFYRCQTEMILTKLGRRMFPCCRFRLSGMEPFQNYILAMDILPVDNYRYKWSGKGWEPNGKPEPHVSRLFVHPESPATGLHWMQNPVSFYKLKLCNSLDHEEHIILQSMHRYLPRLHIIPADKAIKPSLLDAPNIITLSFPQTEFFAVTAYQNLCITQLKIDYNPFAKGFREDAVNARSSIAKNGISIEELESEVKPSKEMTTLGNLKTLFMKRNASVKVNKDLKLPSPTNAEKTIVNGDALAMDTDIKALCKKRPSQVALSDFIKGARVKVKRASLEDVMKTKKDLQTSTFCEKNEVMDVSANVEKGKQFIIKEEKVVDECTTTDLITRTALLKSEEIMVESYEKNTERETSPSRDKNTPHSDGKVAEAFLSNEVKSKSNAKKVPSHKRPERVPLPLLAQFLKQRKFMTRPTTPKTGPQESSVDCEKSSETIQTPQSSSISLSSSICLSPNLDSQPAVPSGSQSVTLTTDLKFTTLSSPSSSSVSADAELSVGFSTSQVSIDPFNDPNTSSKPESDQTPNGIFSVDFMTDFENALGSQSDISSVFACDPVDDSCTTITSKAHNTDIVTQPVNPSTLSVFDASDIISYPKLASISNLATCESISDKLFESSKGSCQEILSEVHPNPEFDESISVPLKDTPTPSFSLPSIASSPDPFPTAIFNDRSAPPRKSLDPCVDRLLHFKGSLDGEHFLEEMLLTSPPSLNGSVAPTDSLQSGISNNPAHTVEPSDPQSISSERPDQIYVDAAISCENIVSEDVAPKPSNEAKLKISTAGDDRCPTITSKAHNINIITPPVNPSTLSVFDAPPDIISYPGLTSISNVAECESISEILLESSKCTCPEILSEVHPNPVFVESVSMLLDGTPSPSFSFPSSASSSPDPFPAALFNDRSAPPRKSLDPCIERLLHFKGSVDRELFPEALFQKRPVSPQNTIYPDPKSVAPTDSLPSGILNDPANPMEPSDPENISSETKDSILYVDAADDCENIVSENCLATKPCNETKLKKSKAKQKKNFKMFFEENEASKGSLPVPMQPSLEDVDGQLFVSFMTKKALKIHLGDVRKDEKIEVKQPAAAELIEQSNLSIKRSIEALQEALEVDLEIMKNRQVIHPVLQEVGLKLNLLDVTLAIDLQYLGVRLPIPPYKKSHKRTSCEAGFVSRTGKTTDVTQIKGWKDKFTGSEPLSEGVSSTDPGQRNLSAFCSDMLDEYLASEGKLIDERAATLCPTDTTPVAYQLPTKSTSYVRTLDSVLKKNVPTLSSTIPSTFKGKTKFMPKVKEKLKKPLKPVKVKQTKPVLTNDKPALRMRTAITNKKMNNSDHEMSSPKKPPVENSPVQVFNKTPKVRSQDSHLKVTPSVSTEERSPSLPKTLMKLMDVEDGAVWEGKHRTFITEERAAIALATLSTSEGVSKGNPDAFRIIRRRAPPCLNLFCRLGCVCGSLVHSRRHHHCGKPQCMMGCSCLRRKVIALKNPKEEDITMDGPETCGVSENDTWKKKSKMRKTYVFTQPEAAPEPVKHVKTLWNQNRRGFDPEGVFGPPPSKCLHSASSFREPPLDDERALNPLKPKKEVEEKTESLIKGEETNQTCARSRPFHFNRLDGQKTGYKHISGTSSEIEEGELLPQNLPGPAKRLEIISECSWPNPDSRDEVMRIVCEHMAQDHLKDPFWIGNYLIKPISQSSQEEDTYRVVISQRILQPEAENQQVPQSNLMKTDEVKKHKLKKDREKKDEENNDKGNIQQVKKDKEKKDEVKKHMVKKDWVEENKVRGLPFLSKCCPAGFLKAEKKAPDAPGSIIVNGKPYPQAKLELGQMGALHPANRLAAYITGRICPNPSIAKLTVPSTTVTTLTTVACSPAPVSMSLVGSNVTTLTTVACSPAPVSMSLVGSNGKSPLGKVFTHFVVSNFKSHNTSNCSSTQLQPSVPKMVIPSMLMLSKEAGVPGMVLSTHEPDLVTQVSEPSCSTGCTRLSDVAKGKGPFITIHSPSLPLSGAIKSSATAVSSAVLLTTVSSPAVTTALPSHGLRTSVTAPINSTTVSSPAVMTAVSSPPLTTVTSSALKDTLTAPTTKTIVSSAPQNKTVLIKINNTEGAQISKPTVQTPVSQASRQKMILKVMRTADGNTLYRSPDGQLMQLVPLSQFKGINPNLLSQSQVKLIRLPKSPTINLTESQGGSSTTTSIPVTLSQTKSPVIVAIPKPLPSSTKPAPALVSSIPSTLKVVEGLAGQSGTCTLRVLSPASSTLPLTLMKSDSLKPVSVNFAEEQIGPATKHPNIDAAKQEDLSVGITENAFDAPLFSVIPSNPSLLPGAETEPNIDAKHSADSEVVEILSDSTDVTDDSEFYSDEDAVHSNVSDKEVLEPEEIVDIETIKEAEDKDSYLKLRLNALRLKQRTKRNYYENDLDIKVKGSLGGSSEQLQASENSILTKANEQIKSLVKQQDSLVKERQALLDKRQHYIERLSHLTDKSSHSINLNQITTNENTIETQPGQKTKRSKFNKKKKQNKPKYILNHKLVDRHDKPVEKDGAKPIFSPSKPIDLSTKKHRLQLPEIDATQPASKLVDANSRKNAVKAQDSTLGGTSEPSNIMTSILETKPQIVTSPVNHLRKGRERTRPNILSRCGSQPKDASPVKEPLLTNVSIPQMLPLMNSIVPCNQIITLNNNPIQPIAITSVGVQQSTTPGVASVSIVPTISQPLMVGNPLPILQPQFINITNSPLTFNTQGNSNIHTVISVVPQTVNPVLTQDVPKDTPVVQTEPTSASSVETPNSEKTTNPEPKDVPKQSQDINKAAASPSKEEHLKKKSDCNDPEDENLLSLLDELVLLSQQLTNEDELETSSEERRVVVPGDVQSSSEKQETEESDDGRSLSPLFLTLDEDLMSPDSKDEIDMTRKVDDLVKDIFGSDSSLDSSDSLLKTQSSQAPTCSIKGDSSTPPPLTYMKAALEATSGQSSSERTSVTWRPMPKLVPLGLKTQDAKGTGSTAFSLDSKEPQI